MWHCTGPPQSFAWDGSLQEKLLFVTCLYSCERSHSPASGLWLRVRRRVNAFIHRVDVLVSQILFTHDEEVEVSVAGSCQSICERARLFESGS